MSLSWTNQQRAVIDARDRDILVSAAAGAGKTTVLTERIFERVTDREHPVHIDEMLIVTYTEAAARQMKTKIRERLTEAAQSKDIDEAHRDYLREQLIRLPQAPISTIHGFCLDVIRNWFHVIDLEPDFRICADEGERTMLAHEVLDELLEEEYHEARDDFMELAEAYAGKRDDKALEDWILSVHQTALSFPDPIRWLRESMRLYDSDGEGAAEREEMILLYVREMARELKERIQMTLADCLRPGGPYVYEDALQEDLAFFASVADCDDPVRIRERAQGHVWPRLTPVSKDDAVDEDLKKACQRRRNSVKEEWDQLVSRFIEPTREMLAGRLALAGRQGRELVRLVMRFDAMFTEKKRQKKVLDFGDMEHLALEILQTRDEQGKDHVAAYYREHFAEVMVDEYQDSNFLQDAILTSVSGGDRHNLFMVGDVKQSIYRFRNARPEMFIKKQNDFDSYEESRDNEQVCIFLSQNFRSDGRIIDFVNQVFVRLMDRAVGGISYDEDAALHEGADLPQGPEREIETWVVPRIPGTDHAAREAALVAQRIRTLLADQLVTDRETGQLRPARYSDIAILSRSLSNWAESFYEAITAEGIPLLMARKEGYYQTQEVSLMIEMLKLIGNVRQDLPLAAVMTSCIGGFTDDELARIRLAGRQYEHFYEAVEAYRAPDDALQDKIENFLAMIDNYCREAAYLPVHRLLARIMEETGALRYYEAMPGGVQRRANLDLLIDKARSYAETGYRGLPRFLEYIEQIDSREIDVGEADLLNENADVVRMTTIHRSKGLEYPIVILVGMGQGFNRGDRSGKVLLHPELGLGLEAYHTETHEKSSTTVRDIIRRRITGDELGEEMRVLYVAMTRARERLIMTGSVQSVETEQDMLVRYSYAAAGAEQILPLDKRMGAGCFYDWVLPIVISIRAGGDETVRLFFADADEAQDAGAGDPYRDFWAREDARQVEGALLQTLKEQMDYRYPFESTRGIPRKVSVSDIKRAQREKEEEQDTGGKYIPDDIPKCAQREDKIDPARMGTVVHAALKALDFTRSWDETALDAVLDELAAKGYFTPEEAGQIDREELTAFLQSDLCARMAAASKEGRLWEERPFVIGVDAQEVDEGYPAGETVLVQGIIDAYFEEDGQIVLVDYKTDHRVDDRELTDRYEKQLAWYAQALERLTGMTVGEQIIYSLTLQHEIRIK